MRSIGNNNATLTSAKKELFYRRNECQTSGSGQEFTGIPERGFL